jgi:hypothetical protein
MRAAEAQFELLRVQRAKVDLVNGAPKQLERANESLPEGERAALVFMRKSKTLAAFGLRTPRDFKAQSIAAHVASATRAGGARGAAASKTATHDIALR